jgi:hypothetical protein
MGWVEVMGWITGKKPVPPPKRSSGLGFIIILAVVGYFYLGGSGSFSSHSGNSVNVSVPVSLSSFQACVIHNESAGQPQVWNSQGYPYWGLYQFGKPLWTGAGGESSSSWGNADGNTQTEAFVRVMKDPAGCENWYPSDGCRYPQGGCG